MSHESFYDSSAAVCADAPSTLQPPKADENLKRKIPLESARVGAEDDSMLDNMVNDLGIETDMRMESKTSSRSAISKVLELQACVIDQHFLRSQSSQSNDIQGQETNHSLQDISTPVIEERRVCTVGDEHIHTSEPGQTNQHKREKNLNGHRPGACEKTGALRWPRACEKTAWDTVNTDLCFC